MEPVDRNNNAVGRLGELMTIEELEKKAALDLFCQEKLQISGEYAKRVRGCGKTTSYMISPVGWTRFSPIECESTRETVYGAEQIKNCPRQLELPACSPEPYLEKKAVEKPIRTTIEQPKTQNTDPNPTR